MLKTNGQKLSIDKKKKSEKNEKDRIPKDVRKTEKNENGLKMA